MNIAVFGALGRVGGKVTEIAKKRGHNVWEIDENCETNVLPNVDAVIDFSAAQATLNVCEFCLKNRCILVTGVTGRNDEQTAYIEELKKQVKVVEKANFSLGIAFLEKVCEIAACELKGWDCEIVETHRRGKKDSPSGTAKRLAGKIADKKGSFSSVTIHSQRLGSAVGTHSVTFATNGESVTVTHQAESVEIFALGAILDAENAYRNSTANQ